jgi:3-oxoacyl-[acyl-carrier protein] reductase
VPRLYQKTALITGGASGIGRAIARLFAAEGAAVVIADISAEAGEQVAGEIRDSGGRALFIPTDVSRSDQVTALVARALAGFGRIDILVNDAACWKGDTTITEVTEEVWDRVIDGSLKSVFLVSRAVIPEMMRTGGGSIVSISSVNGIYGVGLTAYSAAKAGILALTKVIASEYGCHRIRANAILPGTIGTRNSLAVWEANPGSLEKVIAAYPLGHIGRPEDVAHCALFLASDEAAFVTGAEYLVDGGLTAGRNFGF